MPVTIEGMPRAQSTEQPTDWLHGRTSRPGHGFIALRSFFLGDDVDGGDGGDYLRSFGVELAPSPDGRPMETIAAEILNTSVIEPGGDADDLSG